MAFHPRNVVWFIKEGLAQTENSAKNRTGFRHSRKATFSERETQHKTFFLDALELGPSCHSWLKKVISYPSDQNKEQMEN